MLILYNGSSFDLKCYCCINWEALKESMAVMWTQLPLALGITQFSKQRRKQTQTPQQKKHSNYFLGCCVDRSWLYFELWVLLIRSNISNLFAMVKNNTTSSLTSPFKLFKTDPTLTLLELPTTEENAFLAAEDRFLPNCWDWSLISAEPGLLAFLRVIFFLPLFHVDT